jgi:hypothetical protein
MNRENRLSLSKSYKPLFYSLKERRKPEDIMSWLLIGLSGNSPFPGLRQWPFSGL